MMINGNNNEQEKQQVMLNIQKIIEKPIVIQ